jgi:chromosome segregation ATPase
MTEQSTAPTGTGAAPASSGSSSSEPAAADVAARVSTLETKIDAILAKLGQGEQTAHAAAEQHEETKLDRPTAIADEVRSQIDQARQREQEQQARDGQTAELASLRAELKELQEKIPGTPVRRIERMWA